MPSASHSEPQSNELRVADIVIAGAGVMGAALAYWLTRIEPGLSVVLVERDTSFGRASSSLSASSIRQQFSSPVNIALSRFGIEFLRQAHSFLEVNGDTPELALREPGYLYLVDSNGEAPLRAAHAIQRQHGASVALLSAPEMKARFTWLNVDDLALGSLGLQGEGWFDGPALHQGLLRKALAQGAKLVRGEVSGIESSSHQRAERVRLTSGDSLACKHFVIAAGSWSGALARRADLALSVSPRRRTVFVLSSPTPLTGCPLIIDPSGFWLRPEGDLLLYGSPPIDDRDDLPLEPDWRELDESRWAQLAHRIPALEAMRIERAWAGYYEMHHLDHNAVIGPHPAIDNLWFLTGFSGHGMQHAPGAGLALAEWILKGSPLSVDVRELSYERVLQNAPFRELNVIG